MLKLAVGERARSSWSMRGWLAVKQSGLPFEEVNYRLYAEDWPQVQASDPLLAVSGGKVPLLWDDEVKVWDSSAILEWLADSVGRDRFWPTDPAARAFARSMAAEMHSSFQALRTECSMNLDLAPRKLDLSAAALGDVRRIDTLWSEARHRFGANGPYLFGAFGAADIAYAPVVTRFVTYRIDLSPVSSQYLETMLEHPWLREWMET